MASQGEFQEKFSAFIEQLDKNYHYYVEIRNPNYLNDSYFRFLKSLNLKHVFLQEYYMPSVMEVYDKYRKDKNGEGTYERIQNKIQYLAKKIPDEVRISVLVKIGDKQKQISISDIARPKIGRIL